MYSVGLPDGCKHCWLRRDIKHVILASLTFVVVVRSLPDIPIMPVGLIDNNGINGLFSSYLSFSDAWDRGNKTQVAWPACVSITEGASGAIAAVQSTDFAIGCASFLDMTCPACLYAHAISLELVRAWIFLVV